MFITFEGPEGSGKTTVANIIVRHLEDRGFKVVHTREPGGTPIAEAIRNVILDKKDTALDPRAEALLFAASRRQHLVEKVWPAIKEGKVVVCDRYLDSSLAYQGGARDLGVDNILQVNMFATEGTFPDITFLFDIDPNEGLKRIAKNANREVNRLDLEKIEFHQKVRATFLELAKKYQNRFIVIDASKPLENVVDDTWKALTKKLGI